MKKVILICLFSFVSLFAFEELNEENFEQKISDKNAVVKFYAIWCTNCKAQEKNLKQLDQDKLNISIYKVNIEEQMSLTQKYQIKVIPTTIYLKNGKLISTDFGIKSVNELKKNIQQNF